MAAEKVRGAEGNFSYTDIEDARTQGIHTCHSECPCQTGGKPVPDFIEARTQADDVGCCGGECGCKT